MSSDSVMNTKNDRIGVFPRTKNSVPGSSKINSEKPESISSAVK